MPVFFYNEAKNYRNGEYEFGWDNPGGCDGKSVPDTSLMTDQLESAAVHDKVTDTNLMSDQSVAVNNLAISYEAARMPDKEDSIHSAPLFDIGSVATPDHLRAQVEEINDGGQAVLQHLESTSVEVESSKLEHPGQRVLGNEPEPVPSYYNNEEWNHQEHCYQNYQTPYTGPPQQFYDEGSLQYQEQVYQEGHYHNGVWYPPYSGPIYYQEQIHQEECYHNGVWYPPQTNYCPPQQYVPNYGPPADCHQSPPQIVNQQNDEIQNGEGANSGQTRGAEKSGNDEKDGTAITTENGPVIINIYFGSSETLKKGKKCMKVTIEEKEDSHVIAEHVTSSLNNARPDIVGKGLPELQDVVEPSLLFTPPPGLYNEKYEYNRGDRGKGPETAHGEVKNLEDEVADGAAETPILTTQEKKVDDVEKKEAAVQTTEMWKKSLTAKPASTGVQCDFSATESQLTRLPEITKESNGKTVPTPADEVNPMGPSSYDFPSLSEADPTVPLSRAVKNRFKETVRRESSSSQSALVLQKNSRAVAGGVSDFQSGLRSTTEKPSVPNLKKTQKSKISSPTKKGVATKKDESGMKSDESRNTSRSKQVKLPAQTKLDSAPKRGSLAKSGSAQSSAVAVNPSSAVNAPTTGKTHSSSSDVSEKGAADKVHEETSNTGTSKVQNASSESIEQASSPIPTNGLKTEEEPHVKIGSEEEEEKKKRSDAKMRENAPFNAFFAMFEDEILVNEIRAARDAMDFLRQVKRKQAGDLEEGYLNACVNVSFYEQFLVHVKDPFTTFHSTGHFPEAYEQERTGLGKQILKHCSLALIKNWDSKEMKEDFENFLRDRIVFHQSKHQSTQRKKLICLLEGVLFRKSRLLVEDVHFLTTLRLDDKEQEKVDFQYLSLISHCVSPVVQGGFRNNWPTVTSIRKNVETSLGDESLQHFCQYIFRQFRIRNFGFPLEAYNLHELYFYNLFQKAQKDLWDVMLADEDDCPFTKALELLNRLAN
ncbi:hypothetical protein CAEBREN_14581 [Caenorhabditis brenneri]|uniref:Uncharacterized protein n=1 Tax=Caenorhabditis brenneri TaxID=135651 RepID=G0MWB5_CAEBE|nr:hypothetical protein CAEBREN_14581 [Caenorhabditis brenneri]